MGRESFKRFTHAGHPGGKRLQEGRKVTGIRCEGVNHPRHLEARSLISGFWAGTRVSTALLKLN